MKNIFLLSMVASLGFASFSVNAARPLPVSPYSGFGVSCVCDWSTSPGTCTVSWSDVGARTYGVGIEFNAEWNDGGVDMSSEAYLDLDENWACDSGGCSASGSFILPYYSPGAVIAFEGKVKGFNTGPDGVVPRNFAKETGTCNLPGDDSPADDEVDDGPVIDPNQY
jgi:hypothetical protein